MINDIQYCTVCTVLLTTIVNKKSTPIGCKGIFSTYCMVFLRPQKTIFAHFPQAWVGIDLPAKGKGHERNSINTEGKKEDGRIKQEDSKKARQKKK